MSFTLRVLDSKRETLEELQRVFGNCPSIEVVRTDKVLYLQPPFGLDALYLTLPATERWGVRPLIHKSQIVQTSISDRQQGLPPYIVTGTCLAEGDPRGPIPETSLLVSAVFQALRDFNAENVNPIRVVGFWAVDLLRMVKPGELRAILRDAVPELKLDV